MSYPPTLYTGEDGEITASYRPNGHEPELTYPKTGNTVHYLATHASTGGQYGMYRWEMGPAPSGPDPHFHRTISESFYILTGTIRIYDGTKWIDCTPGDFVHVPAGAYTDSATSPASRHRCCCTSRRARHASGTSRACSTSPASPTRNGPPSTSNTTTTGSNPMPPRSGHRLGRRGHPADRTGFRRHLRPTREGAGGRRLRRPTPGPGQRVVDPPDG
ncbi:cupin domain-containing protein [Phytohabitans flavus]|uniref:cupin domain-containing protein n=1 Tax=Phytohabitans flavus TaxID=1076124 RepID=UPI00362F4617